MAGGSGERFWPLSRRSRPKQLLRLTRPDMSLLQEAVSRLDGVVDSANVFVATGRHLRASILAEGGLGIPDENVIAEPCKRNTAGCLCYAAAVLARRYPDVMPEQLAIAVLTADHQIGDDAEFRRCLEVALNSAVSQDALITIGIKPTRPETGYGHIEFAGQTDESHAPGRAAALPVVRFLEKPGRQLAEVFFRSGRFLWNSGMFFWTLAAFRRELAEARPEMNQAVTAMIKAMSEGNEEEADRAFAAMESISIDYALMEKASNVRVVPSSFAWDDIGAWDALDRTFVRNGDGNIAVGESVAIDTTDSIIYNASSGNRVAVATVGISDMVVVVADDAVLVVPKSRAQDVKSAVKALRDKEAEQL